jgi:hypothetical protein
MSKEPKKIKGAGGSEGGMGQFFLGILMMCGGFYMLLNAIQVTSHFGFGSRLYGFNAFGGFGVTGGMLMIPFLFGVGFIFYNGKSILGWILSLGSIVALVFGVLSSVRFNLKMMTSFELIVILVLSVGGLGLFLRSLRSVESKFDE